MMSPTRVYSLRQRLGELIKRRDKPCLGGDQIRFNFGVKIKYSLNTLRQHLANILSDKTT